MMSAHDRAWEGMQGGGRGMGMGSEDVGEVAPSPLDAAIELHAQHMENPESATPESQAQLMELLLAHKQSMAGGEGEMEMGASEAEAEGGMGRMR